MTELGLGTYRCRDVAAAATMAIRAGATVIDTAPVYAAGYAQSALSDLLADHPQVRVSTKIGYLTTAQAKQAAAAGVLHHLDIRHCIEPAYVVHQLAVNAAELGHAPVALTYLHNPDHGHTNRRDLLARIGVAFWVLHRAVITGRIGGYGVATWNGFTDRSFTVSELHDAATQAGDPDGLAAIQLPLSLVNLAPIADTLRGRGPIADATSAGIQAWASAPLHGGQLAQLVTPDLAELIHPGLSPAQAALHVVASTPGLAGVLISTTDPAHWRQATQVVALPALAPERLEEICAVLRT